MASRRFPERVGRELLVLLADDAFTFLLSWEVMSLTSWALVMAHHKEGDNARAGFIYLIMASFGTAALLLAFGLLAGADGDYLFTAIREHRHADNHSLVATSRRPSNVGCDHVARRGVVAARDIREKPKIAFWS